MSNLPQIIKLELEDCSDAMVDYVEQLQTRCNELAAQVQKLRVAATVVLNSRDKDGITTSGLFAKFEELSKALSFLPDEYLADHDREVAARGVDEFIDLFQEHYPAFCVERPFHRPVKMLKHCRDIYDNKIRAGEVDYE